LAVSDRRPEQVLWDFVRGAMMTRALGIVADLRIAQTLADGPRDVDALASSAGVDADSLYRVLRALASDGVFEEREARVFANTAVSDALRDESWTSFAHLFGDVFYDGIGDLDRAVREGRATFADTLGTDFWSWLREHPDDRRAFDAAMSGGKEQDVGALAELHWRDGEVVVDLGGGDGSLLKELLRHRPDLRGVVFDLPETVRDESSFPAGLEFVAGSFFESVPRGDTYVTSGILHDWGDDDVARILHTVRTNAPSGARFVAVETVLTDGNEPGGAKWLDLLMLILSGRERTEPEWRTLFETSGFTVERVANRLIEARCP
jgi:O-methyltransferase domain